MFTSSRPRCTSAALADAAKHIGILLLISGMSSAPAFGCTPLNPDSYTAEDARRLLRRDAIIIDGLVTEPMRLTKIGISPATVRITKVWYGPQLRSVQIHYASNCDSTFFQTGERLSFIILDRDTISPFYLPLIDRLSLMFDSDIGPVRWRFDTLFTTQNVFTMNAFGASKEGPYYQELRRLLGAERVWIGRSSLDPSPPRRGR